MEQNPLQPPNENTNQTQQPLTNSQQQFTNNLPHLTTNHINNQTVNTEQNNGLNLNAVLTRSTASEQTTNTTTAENEISPIISPNSSSLSITQNPENSTSVEGKKFFYFSFRKKVNRKYPFLNKEEFEILRQELIKNNSKVKLIGFQGSSVKRDPLGDWRMINQIYLQAEDTEARKSLNTIINDTCIQFNSYTSGSKKTRSKNYNDYKHIFEDPEKYPIHKFVFLTQEELEAANTENQTIRHLDESEELPINTQPTHNLNTTYNQHEVIT